MTAAIIALAVALAGALATLAYLAVRLSRVTPELVSAGKSVITEAERAQSFREERDEALLRLKEAAEREAAAIVRLKLAERRANSAAEEERKHVVERIRAARISDAARIVDELLSEPLPGVSTPGAAATESDRATEDTVRVTSAAATGSAGRGAGPKQP